MERIIVLISFFAAVIAGAMAYYTGENPVLYALTYGLLTYVISWTMITIIILIMIYKGSIGLTRLVFWR